MKRILTYILALFTSTTFACGGGEWYEIMDFYSLFMQTNVSTTAYYPFLRDANSVFYGNYDYYTENKTMVYPQGNINLWKHLLPNWEIATIEKAVYGKDFNWADKNSKLEKRVKIYIDFAKKCSHAFAHRVNKGSWEYEKILKEHPVDTDAILNEAKALLAKEKNKQLKARYQYQIIRILHYGERWQEAIVFYEANVENNMPKNEIYYYSTDQVAGCHYSKGRYDYAAYLYTKIFAKSIDRKKSAFLSYNFCTLKEVDGRNYIAEGVEALEDEKNFLIISSLRNFTNEIDNINSFINLDAADTRIELLFARALNNAEITALPKNIGVKNDKLPSLSDQNKHSQLLAIAKLQFANSKVKNKDYWQLASSYLYFINGDIKTAKEMLSNVKTLSKQQRILAIVYEVSSWDTITPENEKYITKILNNYPKLDNMYGFTEDDIRHFILDKIAHVYYKNKQLAKAYLVHNKVEATKHISSLELLDALEAFYEKKEKSSYEKSLIPIEPSKTFFVEYINHQKGIYYLYHAQPEKALTFFNKSGITKGNAVPNTVFSNNIKECFSCKVEEVMDDQVYQASVFDFIKPAFTRKELAGYLIELEQLTSNTTKWKAKLANYLLGNYYFNISNTGYYRGILNGDGNCCDYSYVDYASDNYSKEKIGEDIITNKKGYNLSDISFFEKRYFNVSTTAKEYYQKVVALSKDKELNARCLYLMAKCELNDFYNNGSENTFSIDTKYASINLPKYQSFKTLKEDYSKTKFHDMIIRECSYFRYYSAMD